ncbi:biotin/lipoyl-binding protein [Mycolicibacterium confluentis]|nr:biotin/lipoyl-binding protein [Mycolicibacterium confluentis]
MPQFGETVTEATVLQWLCKVGDTVTAFTPVLEIATDKVDTEVPAPVTGRVTELLVAEGDTVPVGTPLARIDTVLAVEEDLPSADTPDSPKTVVWRHTQSPRKRRSTAATEVSPRRHQLSPRQRRSAALEAAERAPEVEQTVVTATAAPRTVMSARGHGHSSATVVRADVAQVCGRRTGRDTPEWNAHRHHADHCRCRGEPLHECASPPPDRW